jgi:hypothetical protein
MPEDTYMHGFRQQLDPSWTQVLSKRLVVSDDPGTTQDLPDPAAFTGTYAGPKLILIESNDDVVTFEKERNSGSSP